jgi:hypothetical protein
LVYQAAARFAADPASARAGGRERDATASNTHLSFGRKVMHHKFGLRFAFEQCQSYQLIHGKQPMITLPP